ncbi:UNVERIFIED_CONTAM: hypothetical protein NCL1_17831 [Trichonephila clavipes]
MAILLKFSELHQAVPFLVEKKDGSSQCDAEEISKWTSREKIKDLECVETVLTLHTYEYCFEITDQNPKESEEDFQKDVKEGISCTNQANKGCSKEAKTSLNRMVRIILGIAQPFEEIIEDEIQPTEPPPPKRCCD